MRGSSSGMAIPGRRAHTSLGLAPEIDSIGDESPAEPIFTSPGVSSLPHIKTYSRNDRSVLSQKVKQGLLDPTQYYIYAESYGGVEFYRRKARKAESAMQLEQKQYQYDLERSHELIQRLKARISALESLVDERDTDVEHQRRKVRQLRHQLQYNCKAYEKDMAYTRAQLDITEKKLSMLSDENKRRVMEVKNEISKKDSTLEMLQNDMAEIVKCVEEPIESFYLPDYFGQRTDTRKRTEGMKIAAKILKIRIDHDDMLKDTRSRDNQINSLMEEIKSIKKGADEATKFRDSALASLRTLEGMAEKIEGLDRIVAGSVLLKGIEVSVEKSTDKVSTPLSRLQAMLQILVSKADAANRSSNLLQYEQEKCGALLTQMKEDLGLAKLENEGFYPLLTAIREQVRRKLDTLQKLEKEKSTAEASVTKNASKTRQLERNMEDLTNKQRRLKAERDQMADSLKEAEKGKDALEKQISQLQKALATVSSSLQSGDFSTANTAGKILGLEELGKIIGCFESLTQDKKKVESKIKKINEQLSELLEVLGKLEKKADLTGEISFIISRVSQLTKENESLTSKLNEYRDFGKKRDNQLESTLQRVTEGCGEIKGAVRKLQQILGDGSEKEKTKPGTALAELEEVTLELSGLVSKVMELKKDRELLNAKVSEFKEVKMERGALNAKLAEVNGATNTALSELKEVKTERDALNGKLAEVNGAMNRTLSELKEVKSERDVLNAKLAEADGTQNTRLSELKEVKAEKDALNAKLDEVNATLNTRLSELKEVKAERDALNAKLAEADGTQNTRLSELKEVKAERDALNTKLDEVNATLNARLSELKEVKAERDALNVKITELKELKTEQESLNVKLEEVAELKNKHDSLNLKLDELSKERDSLNARLAEADRKVMELDRVQQTLKAMQFLLPEVGKSLDSISLLEMIKQELVSSKDTKEKALGRAQTLSVQASQLDLVIKEICSTVQDIGGTPFVLKGEDACGKLICVRDKLVELKVSITSKLGSTSGQVQELQEKVKFLEGLQKNSEKKWSERMELVKNELTRLGGCDVDNKVEYAKRIEAAAKVKQFLQRANQNDATVNPLSNLAAFNVELLVNNKVHSQLQVGGTMGGVYQAAVHYFRIESQTGHVTFENAAIPGSQSSNMLVELVLNSMGNNSVYESKAGDVLGLSVKVKAIDDQNPREILYNSNIIRTDEVMEAIKGQTLDNFSLWPDLVSSWKWERSPTKGWTLITIKWRFLLKSIFPELSEPLQTLAISNRPTYDRSQTIKTL